ncbi:hypothetical protein Y032_0012g1786 [Ancylostoma ceylanicum]|uniref:PAN domain protein n=1 Tax=Ancylostoma ceylanicum TaxID=53326 RepID=A0A016VDB2_9BILA|nr:hypothetical protein Y032_0012g1786 [Ancylostoma ceylanicum]
MSTKKRLNLLTLCIHLGQIHATTACTFTKRNDTFNAVVKYEIMLGSEELCLMACYEEPDCAFAEYFQGSCAVYKSGSDSQAGHGNAFEFDRQLSSSSCRRRMQFVDNTVKFETIAPVNTDNRACSGLPNSATGINVFQGKDKLRFYSTNMSFLSDGAKPHRRTRSSSKQSRICHPERLKGLKEVNFMVMSTAFRICQDSI